MKRTGYRIDTMRATNPRSPLYNQTSTFKTLDLDKCPTSYLYLSYYDGTESLYYYPLFPVGLLTRWTENLRGYAASIIIDYGEFVSKVSDFSMVHYLRKISLPFATVVGENTFYDCSQLSIVNLPNLEYIGSFGFAYCTALENIYFPEVVSVSNFAFRNCDTLKTVDLPKVETLSGLAFYQCPDLVSVNAPNLTYGDLSTFAYCTSLESLSFPILTKADVCMFKGCTMLSDVYIPMVDEVKDEAFMDCTALETISLPNVTHMLGNAFGNCTNLKSVYAPLAEGIHYSVFNGCTALETISLPKADVVGPSAFMNCSNLKSVYLLKNSIAEIKVDTFKNCNQSLKVYVPFGLCQKYIKSYGSNKVELYGGVIKSFDELIECYLPEGGNLIYLYYDGTMSTYAGKPVLLYGDYNAQNATGVYDLAGVVSGLSYSNRRGTFQGCSYLETVDFPNVEDIGSSCFANCENLTDVSLPQCTWVSNYAFTGCSMLSEISLPLCSNIRNGAFGGCINLSVAYLDTVTWLDRAFVNCRELKDVYLGYSKSVIYFEFGGQNLFADCNSSIKIHVPSNLYSSYISKYGKVYIGTGSLTYTDVLVSN